MINETSLIPSNLTYNDMIKELEQMKDDKVRFLKGNLNFMLPLYNIIFYWSEIICLLSDKKTKNLVDRVESELKEVDSLINSLEQKLYLFMNLLILYL